MTFKRLPRGTPEARGVRSTAVLAFVDDLASRASVGQEPHGFMLLRGGSVVAEGWWAPYGPDMPHMLFSLSKSFTSTAIGMAVDEGKLTVEDRVIDHFPDLLPETVSGNLGAMRVRHLLSMSTGHSNDVSDHLYSDVDGDWVRGFLKAPVDHEPGTYFCYDTPATYMLSAILRRITGETLMEYLGPRLFGPLGIEGATWQSCPKGTNTGGYGLSVKTEDIAKLGLLYLRKGMWEGQRLLSAGWVAEATSKRVDNAPNHSIDWEQGYGYQFWMCRHGAYRGDGAFGQYCVVLPDRDAVIAITGGFGDMQAVLDSLWMHLLPGFAADPLPEDPEGLAALKDKLDSLGLQPCGGGIRNSVMEGMTHGRTYALEPNNRGLTSMTFDFATDPGAVRLTGEKGVMVVPFGFAVWPDPAPCLMDFSPSSVKGTWREDGKLEFIARHVHTPFVDTYTCTFDEDGGTVDIEIVGNLSFGPVPRESLRGKAR